jgi:hypothetical protein
MTSPKRKTGLLKRSSTISAQYAEATFQLGTDSTEIGRQLSLIIPIDGGTFLLRLLRFLSIARLDCRPAQNAVSFWQAYVTSGAGE